MNDFERKEIEGRNKVINLFNQYELTPAKDPYAHWDLSGSTQTIGGDNKNFFIEIKDRNVDSTAYNATGAYLENKKLKNLTTLSNEYNADIFYCSIYTDNVAYIYNLKNISITDVEFLTKELKISTYGNTKTTDKEILNLPYRLAQKYKIK